MLGEKEGQLCAQSTRAFKEARRKSNKSSQGSIASSHSPATYRDATSHQANSIPKHHANDNCHGKRRRGRSPLPKVADGSINAAAIARIRDVLRSILFLA